MKSRRPGPKETSARVSFAAAGARIIATSHIVSRVPARPRVAERGIMVRIGSMMSR
jgi:hypothetical protein